MHTSPADGSSRPLTIPYVDVGKSYGWQLMRLEPDEYDAKRDALVDRLYEKHQVAPAPPAWAESPMTRWCWLVLVVNGFNPDPEVHQNMLHFGIDLSWSPEDIRNFIWAIA